MASVLVIKLSALGDLLFALPAMQAIRRRHAEDHLVLLTAERFVPLMRRSGLFDEVWGDSRPRWWQIGRLLDLRQRLLRPRFARVYDLQWSRRSDLYLGLLKASDTYGVAPQARHIYAGRRKAVPIGERHREFLRLAGIDSVPPPDLGFLDTAALPPGLPPRFALLVPGSSRAHLGKRWPAAHWVALGQGLLAAGLPPVLICGPEERDLAASLLRALPGALAPDLDFDLIAALSRRAAVAVGNDTGPAHLVALAGCPLVMLFGPASDPERTRPAVPNARVLRGQPFEALQPDTVLEAALALRRSAADQ